MPTAIELLEHKTNELLDALEDMARQHCYTNKDGMTDSGALSANADALELLAEHKRFRIVRGGGRMICGHWPEDESANEAVEKPVRTKPWDM